MAKLEAHEERAREIESYVADLQEKCEGLLDSEILAVARKGGVEAVKKMLEEPLPEENVVDPSASASASLIQDSRRETRLLRASRLGRLPAVDMFVLSGADTETADALGNTSLMLAAKNGHSPVCASLIKAKAQVDSCNNSGSTPVFMAARFGHDEALQLLLEHGARHDISCRGSTPLYAASAGGHDRVVRQLVMARADPNHTHIHNRDTSLHVAAANGHSRCVACLAAAGAKLDAGPAWTCVSMSAAPTPWTPKSTDLLMRRGALAVNHMGRYSSRGHCAPPRREQRTRRFRRDPGVGRCTHTPSPPPSFSLYSWIQVSVQCVRDTPSSLSLPLCLSVCLSVCPLSRSCSMTLLLADTHPRRSED